jgi:hypothetical protein
MSVFFQLFHLCYHITKGHIPLQIICVLGAICFLTMTKPLGRVRSIVMGEALYQFTSHLSLQFHDTFIPTPIQSLN